MGKTLICLTLTCPTLQENAEMVERYAKFIDIAELRVDFLLEEEQLEVRKFPSMIKIPCILTIRRIDDGGKFNSSEFSRTALFGRALAFADRNPAKNYAYVDFEEDFHVPSLEDAALAFGVKIIRSSHKFDGPFYDIQKKCESMRKTGFEIPKLVFVPKSLSDMTNLFKEAKDFTSFEHILSPLGNLGLPARILSYKIHSHITYCSPKETLDNLKDYGFIEPVTLNNLYNIRNLKDSTEISAITGSTLNRTSLPNFHNAGFRSHGMDRVFIPIPSTSISESLDFAEQVGIKGMAVTYPYKREIMFSLEDIDAETAEINACNTVIRKDGKWLGLNTDAFGFQAALSKFLGFSRLHRKRVAIIGAGGSAHAVAFAIKQMGGRACIFNRTISKAKVLAERYGFSYAQLGIESLPSLEKYSDIIIQTTNIIKEPADISKKENNPIWYYQFKGHEYLFDLIYSPEETPVMKAASEAGCKVSNGFPMLRAQAAAQFKIFTGEEYENSDFKKLS